MTRADFGREDLGSSRARAAPGAAEAAPPLRALRIAVPLLLAHRRAELLHRARLPNHVANRSKLMYYLTLLERSRSARARARAAGVSSSSSDQHTAAALFPRGGARRLIRRGASSKSA